MHTAAAHTTALLRLKGASPCFQIANLVIIDNPDFCSDHRESAYHSMLYPVQPKLVFEKLFSALFLSQCPTVIINQISIVSGIKRTIGFDLPQVDPVILALKIVDNVSMSCYDVELLAVNPLNVGHCEAKFLKVPFHHVFKDETGMDLKTATTAQMNVLEGIEEAGQKVDVRNHCMTYIDKWLECIRASRVIVAWVVYQQPLELAVLISTQRGDKSAQPVLANRNNVIILAS